MLSYGGGQDSAAILRLLIHRPDLRQRYAPNRLIVVMADTGDEHAATYAHVEDTKALCDEHGIEFVHITSAMGYHRPAWKDLIHFYREGNRIGSKAYPKTCTDNLKIQPIYKFLADYVERTYGPRYPARLKKGLKLFAKKRGKIDVLIGIAKGEEKRLAGDEVGPKWMQESIHKVYPLVELGIDRAGAQALIKAYGYDVPPPSHCRRCPFKTDQELLLMGYDDPEGLAEWMELEANKLYVNEHMGERNMGVWGKKTLPEAYDEAMLRYGHMSVEELREHAFSHGHCVASKY
jgi:hypothetical protein